MKLLAVVLLMFFSGGVQLQSGTITKGIIEDFFYSKREHVVILKFEEEDKETKTISIVLSNRGTLMENWDMIDFGDSLYYKSKSDTFQIVKKDLHSRNEKIKVYFKNRSNKLRL